MMPLDQLIVRLATPADQTALHELIEASVRELQAQDYSSAQIEGALGAVLGLDTQLIADGTYFVAQVDSGEGATQLVACGGWSKRKTLFGADRAPGREPDLLNPNLDAAKIRAIFVHPRYARQGLGSLILSTVEDAARLAGFTHFEMGSTLTGVPLYRRKGYVARERIEVPLANGLALSVIRMTKDPAVDGGSLNPSRRMGLRATGSAE